jgi:AraC family transcriptional regulator, regulatory protein of adaptative response / DNA-3-methyladenine glycosylase II
MSLDADICHAAVDARDRRFDGRFYTGVATTGIYCRCICPARTPKRENRSFHRSAAAAEAAGFRPCLICRPELAPGLAPIDAPARLASQAYARIEAGALEEQGLAALAAELGVTDRHLRRVMRAAFGASPIELAQTARLLTARRLLVETGLSVTEIAFAAGFQSLRRFNASMKARYGMSPTRMRGNRAPARGETFSVKLAARGTLDLAPSFAFLAMRALPGVEIGGGDFYTRVVRFAPPQGGAQTVGWLSVRGAPNGVVVTMSENLAPSLRQLVAGVRAAFDLDADIEHVDAFLAADARFAPDIAAEPGVRIAGALDGFETAVRAVLGQQVSVRAARTFGERLAE